jgi:fatty acid desaturase
MKPRRERLDVDGDFRPVRSHSVPLVVLGGLTLLFGFFAFNAVLLAALTLAGFWWVFFALWVVPMATWFQVILRIRNIGEHACVHATDDPFHHARTTLANPIERLLIAPYWVHFHAEHHLFMHIPCWNLPKAHRLLMEKGYGPRMVLNDGYGEVLKIAAPA